MCCLRARIERGLLWAIEANFLIALFMFTIGKVKIESVTFIGVLALLFYAHRIWGKLK